MSKLSEWRVIGGHSQRALAKLAKVDVATISRIEAGLQKNFQPGTMKRIADALGVTQYDIDEFIPYLPPKSQPATSEASAGRLLGVQHTVVGMGVPATVPQS